MGKVLWIKSCSVCNPCTGYTCWSIHHWALSMERGQVGLEWDVSPDLAWGSCVASIGSVWRCVDVDYGVVLVGWNAMFYDKVIRKHLRRSWYHVFLELSLRWKYTSWCQQKTYVRLDRLSEMEQKVARVQLRYTLVGFDGRFDIDSVQNVGVCLKRQKHWSDHCLCGSVCINVSWSASDAWHGDVSQSSSADDGRHLSWARVIACHCQTNQTSSGGMWTVD